ncbi:cob(I)yrinic acid a,c-diamide adenosyltransferase [Phototrophicus methaneseepsis]|uniref:Corrinoid adenosyltransferase n=1 Tax=Phototrophicus methaneseepsis TaxID=2710758 RepID=A0A7S8EBK0_9CHLR|nr:cob(I)yrinic acid a,c-diamide adenosyltransferase [Phototrophicus methaneseepsis]QPC83912.1 cob(I)yrinic acid a,c-diamide adenosyltransferase [Phototrophicus methaneseepsis]
MKIYTRTGDDGTTSLFSGGRVRKDDLRVEAYGTVDELNSVLGMVRAAGPTPQLEDWLTEVQSQLFHLGADLATPLNAKSEWVVRMDAQKVAWLEANIDTMTAELEPLKHFILPGGTSAAAALHLARTVCRRAERLVVALSEQEALSEQVQPYLNRLSDWLFTAARYENQRAGISESQWAVR